MWNQCFIGHCLLHAHNSLNPEACMSHLQISHQPNFEILHPDAVAHRNLQVIGHPLVYDDTSRRQLSKTVRGIYKGVWGAVITKTNAVCKITQCWRGIRKLIDDGSADE